jgi:hypothetical protein
MSVNTEAALIDKYSKLTRRNSHGSAFDSNLDLNMGREGDLFLIPTIRPKRHRRATHPSHRQDSDSGSGPLSGLGDMFSGLGGRFNSFRESFRETVAPVQEALNPLPLLQNMGTRLQEASSNTINRGREMMSGARDIGSRGVSRLRDGMTDAWDNMRDNWEEFWDL